MQKRLLQVTISLPTGDVVLSESLNMKIRIHKAALALQNRASIDVTGLTTSLRERLLTQFTALNKRLVATGRTEQKWVNIKIEAGYLVGANRQTSVIFVGQIVLCEPTSPPPDIGVRITAFTQQIDRTTLITDDRPPFQTTFKEYAAWVAKQMGIRLDCSTSYDSTTITNASRGYHYVSALLPDLQDMNRPDVAAFVDDDVLIVRDRDAIINPGSTSYVTEFIGIPMWTEWGVSFTCMFDTSIRLAQASDLTSKMNPSLNGVYVNMEIDYDLSSRDRAFYVTVGANPPAS